jgi:hypothetical protein
MAYPERTEEKRRRGKKQRMKEQKKVQVIARL